jgi:hypothetical protein
MAKQMHDLDPGLAGKPATSLALSSWAGRFGMAEPLNAVNEACRAFGLNQAIASIFS